MAKKAAHCQNLHFQPHLSSQMVYVEKKLVVKFAGLIQTVADETDYLQAALMRMHSAMSQVNFASLQVGDQWKQEQWLMRHW